MTTLPTYERIGITASRYGITVAQTALLTSALRMLKDVRGAKYLHHGDCVGGDQQAACIARDLGYTIVGHPPIAGGFRAIFPSDEEREPAEYKERDRALVDEVDLLIGCPGTDAPRPRSGTWYTVGYATGTGVRTAVILPDGRWRR